MTNQAELVADYLIGAYRYAEEQNDAATIYRVSRALAALEAPLSMDIFNEEFLDHVKNDMKIVPISWLKH